MRSTTSLAHSLNYEDYSDIYIYILLKVDLDSFHLTYHTLA